MYEVYKKKLFPLSIFFLDIMSLFIDLKIDQMKDNIKGNIKVMNSSFLVQKHNTAAVGAFKKGHVITR